MSSIGRRRKQSTKGRSRTKLGVAPLANLIAYKALDAYGHGDNSDVIAAIERACDPDGDPSTDDAVDVINLSMSSHEYSDVYLLIWCRIGMVQSPLNGGEYAKEELIYDRAGTG